MKNQKIVDFMQVKDFFESWGLKPNDVQSLTDTVTLPQACVKRMLDDAKKFGETFKCFCASEMDFVSDSKYFMKVQSWDQLSKNWTEWSKHKT